jgi:hypothetical protein
MEGEGRVRETGHHKEVEIGRRDKGRRDKGRRARARGK